MHRPADDSAGPSALRTGGRPAPSREAGPFPDTVSRDHWSNRLETGPSYLDLRIALWTSTYPNLEGLCSSLAPPNGGGC